MAILTRRCADGREGPDMDRSRRVAVQVHPHPDQQQNPQTSGDRPQFGERPLHPHAQEAAEIFIFIREFGHRSRSRRSPLPPPNPINHTAADSRFTEAELLHALHRRPRHRNVRQHRGGVQSHSDHRGAEQVRQLPNLCAAHRGRREQAD